MADVLPPPPPPQQLSPRIIIEKLIAFSDEFMARIFPEEQLQPPPPPPPPPQEIIVPPLQDLYNEPSEKFEGQPPPQIPEELPDTHDLYKNATEPQIPPIPPEIMRAHQEPHPTTSPDIRNIYELEDLDILRNNGYINDPAHIDFYNKYSEIMTQYKSLQEEIKQLIIALKIYENDDTYNVNGIVFPEFKKEFLSVFTPVYQKFMEEIMPQLEKYFAAATDEKNTAITTPITEDYTQRFVETNKSRMKYIRDKFDEFTNNIIEIFQAMKRDYIELHELGWPRGDISPSEISDNGSYITPPPPRDFNSSELSELSELTDNGSYVSSPPPPPRVNSSISDLTDAIPHTPPPRPPQNELNLRAPLEMHGKPVAHDFVLGEPDISKLLQFSAKLVAKVLPPPPTPEISVVEPTEQPELIEINEEDLDINAPTKKKPVAHDIALGEPDIQKLLQFSAKIIQHIKPLTEEVQTASTAQIQTSPTKENIHRKPVARDFVLGEHDIQKLLQFSVKFIKHIKPLTETTEQTTQIIQDVSNEEELDVNAPLKKKRIGQFALGEPDIQKLLKFSAKIIQNIKPLKETSTSEPTKENILDKTQISIRGKDVARGFVLGEPDIQKLMLISAKLLQNIMMMEKQKQSSQIPHLMRSAKVVPLEGVIVFDAQKLLLFSNRFLKQIFLDMNKPTAAARRGWFDTPATDKKPPSEKGRGRGWFGMFGKNKSEDEFDGIMSDGQPDGQLEHKTEHQTEEVLDNRPNVGLSSKEGMHVGIFDTNYDIQGKEDYIIKEEQDGKVLYKKSANEMELDQ